MKNLVDYTVFDSAGQRFIEAVEAEQAVIDIQKLAHEEEKWLYLDGQYKEPSDLVASDLIGKKIHLSNIINEG
jgi:hypothetical protein